MPSHRLDVEREIDLVEEVARVYGYAHLPVHDHVTHRVQAERPAERAGRVARQALLSAGFSEAITVTFIKREEAEAFLPAAMGTPIPLAHRGWKGEVLRPSLLPSLLAVRRTNQYAGTPDARVFEVAETFWQEGDATRDPSQKQVVALVGNSVPEVRGAIEALVSRLSGAARLEVAPPPTPADCPWYAPGACGTVSLGGKAVGTLGQFSEELQKRYDLRQPAAGAEVDWDAVLGVFEPVRRASPLPRFPGVERDLSVVLDEAVRWSDVEVAVAGLEHLERVRFVGTFRNKQLGPGKKSLTLSLAFRDPSATLRSEQVDAQVAAAVKTLYEKLGAALRA